VLFTSLTNHRGEVQAPKLTYSAIIAPLEDRIETQLANLQ
jgi:hypothetical protein